MRVLYTHPQAETISMLIEQEFCLLSNPLTIEDVSDSGEEV